MEPLEMMQLVEESRRAWQAIGMASYGVTEAEKKSLVFRRSLYVVKSMKAGDKFTTDNLRVIRPGFGLAPKYFDILLGKSVVCDIERGTALNWDMLV